MNIKDSANKILTELGGSSNVKDLTHCYTRLRFVLKNNDIPNDKKIEQIDGVISVNHASGQYQVIIGNDVADFYKIIKPQLENSNKQETYVNKQEKPNLWNRFVKVITDAILPVIPAIVGGGLVKVILSILNLLGWVTSGTQNYQLLNAIGDAPFYFLPILVAFYAARHFKVNESIAVGLIGILIYPNFISLLSKGNVKFFNVPVYSANYSSQIIPVILIIFTMSFVEPLIDKIIPKVTKTFLEPLVELLVMAPLAFIVIGPIGFILSNWLTQSIQFVYSKTGFVAVAIFAGIYALLVMTGLHQGLGPVILQNMSTLGYDPFMMSACLASNMSQGGAALAVALKSKNTKLKGVAFGASISALFGGVTEPALFGVNMRLKKPLYCAIASSTIVGAFIGFAGLKTYVMVSPGILSLGMFIGGKTINNFIVAIISTVSAIVLSFVFTLIFWNEKDIAVVGDTNSLKHNSKDDVEKSESKVIAEDQNILSPLVGITRPIDKVPDNTFAKKLVGDGIAIEPIEGKVYAPFDGIVETIFPTKHAIGLKSNSGVEVLIHIGINTVELKGKFFELMVKAGDKIKKGQIIETFDKKEIENAGYNLISPIIVVNLNQISGLTVKNLNQCVNNSTNIMVAKS